MKRILKCGGMPGEGLSLPREYSEVNHVDGAVITDIAEWIKTLSK